VSGNVEGDGSFISVNKAHLLLVPSGCPAGAQPKELLVLLVLPETISGKVIITGSTVQLRELLDSAPTHTHFHVVTYLTILILKRHRFYLNEELMEGGNPGNSGTQKPVSLFPLEYGGQIGGICGVE